MASASDRKRLSYQELKEACRKAGYEVHLCPVEVGTLGFIADSMREMLTGLASPPTAVHQLFAPSSCNSALTSISPASSFNAPAIIRLSILNGASLMKLNYSPDMVN